MKSEDKNAPFRLFSEDGEGKLVRPTQAGHTMAILEVCTGTLKLSIGTHLFDAGAGDFFFVPCDTVYAAEAVDGRASMRGIEFDPAIIEENMELIDSELYYMFDVQSHNRVVRFDPEHSVYPTLSRFMKDAGDEFADKEICYKLPIRADIYLMMTVLLRHYCSTKNEQDGIVYHNVLRLRPVIEFIRENLTEKIRIEDLCARINVSPDYFTKMFKESIGKTPIDYINDLRVNRALFALADEKKSIAEIADEIGFCNPNYFHKIFKQYMGTSPTQYRKQI